MKLSEQALQYNLHLRKTLQMIVSELNQGQQRKIVKNPEVKSLLDRYGVEYVGQSSDTINLHNQLSIGY